MADEQEQLTEGEGESEALRDLDVASEDAEKVAGGRARRSSDPCEGGE